MGWRAGASLLGVLFASGAATALEPADIAVRIGARPASAGIERAVTLQPGPRGSRYLDVALTNASGRDVTLEEIAVGFPWEPGLAAEPGALLASGGSCMFRTPTFVHERFEKPIASGAFLLARRSAGGAARHAFAGFLTWRTFWTRMACRNGRIAIEADGEGRVFRAGETLRLERIWLAESDDWAGLLFAYGNEIARENGIVRREWPRYVGWSTWDYYGSRFTYDQIVGNLQELVGLGVGANLLQVDGGWWAQKGDYLTTRADIPGGMKGLAREIRAAGLIPGLHLDGMRADLPSELARRHPEYFLRTAAGELVRSRASASDTERRRLFLDYSHPGARAYMRDVLRTLRRDWGYDYFKVDFLKFGFPEMILGEAGLPRSTRLAPHDPALTSVERFRLAMQAFREGMGDGAFFVACSAEFGPTFGFVDAQRTGGDIDPQYPRFSRATLENGGNFYLHPQVVRHDADYHVVRAKEDEDATRTADPRKTGGDMSLDLAGMWTHYVGLFSFPKISSDNLMILREERRALFREAVALPACDRFVPLDFWSRARHRDDPFAAFLGEAGGAVYLALFNWAETERDLCIRHEVTGDAVGAPVWEPVAGRAGSGQAGGELTVRLRGHSSAVLRARGADFDRLRRRLAVF